MTLKSWPRTWWFFPLVFFVAAIDLASKAVADMLLVERTVQLLPFLSLRLHHNHGISFGLFQAQDPSQAWTLVAMAVSAMALLTWLGLKETHPVAKLGFALIVGGALGNVLDRALDHRVTDFIDAHYGGWHWPTFNVSDAALTVGVVSILLAALLGAREAH